MPCLAIWRVVVTLTMCCNIEDKSVIVTVQEKTEIGADSNDSVSKFCCKEAQIDEVTGGDERVRRGVSFVSFLKVVSARVFARS